MDGMDSNERGVPVFGASFELQKEDGRSGVRILPSRRSRAYLHFEVFEGTNLADTSRADVPFGRVQAGKEFGIKEAKNGRKLFQSARVDFEGYVAGFCPGAKSDGKVHHSRLIVGLRSKICK